MRKHWIFLQFLIFLILTKYRECSISEKLKIYHKSESKSAKSDSQSAKFTCDIVNDVIVKQPEVKSVFIGIFENYFQRSFHEDIARCMPSVGLSIVDFRKSYPGEIFLAIFFHFFCSFLKFFGIFQFFLIFSIFLIFSKIFLKLFCDFFFNFLNFFLSFL